MGIKINNIPIQFGDINSVVVTLEFSSYNDINHDDVKEIFGCEPIPQSIPVDGGLLMFGAQFNSGNQVIDRGLTMGDEV